MVEPLRIVVEEIPHAQQRYPTVGDWWVAADGTWHVRVSNTGKWQHAMLVAIHELVEMTLCVERGIREDAVTQFDLDFEAARPEGNTDEPGDSPYAPYQKEHQFATTVELLLATELGVKWKDYERAIEALP
jgi:hypothetical protein